MTDEEHTPSTTGSMRFQDPHSTSPRPVPLAEQRARQRALIEREQAQAEARRKADTRRKLLIGAGVTVGLVGLIATYYTLAQPEKISATCADSNGVVVENEDFCDPNYVAGQGGYYNSTTGFFFLPLPGGGFSQYRYNYGGTGTVGNTISGGTYARPPNAEITTKSGKTVQRGGFGLSGKSSVGGGKSSGS